MSQEKTFVLTAYGHGGTVDRISICSFDEPEEAFSSPASQARAYCEGMESLELDGDSWVTARAISKFRQYPLEDFTPIEFDMLLKLDDKSIQWVLRETDSQVLARALKGGDTEILDKICRNMSKKGAAMLLEDIEYMGPIRISDVQAARTIILNSIRRLGQDGKMSVEQPEGDIQA